MCVCLTKCWSALQKPSITIYIVLPENKLSMREEKHLLNQNELHLTFPDKHSTPCACTYVCACACEALPELFRDRFYTELPGTDTHIYPTTSSHQASGIPLMSAGTFSVHTVRMYNQVMPQDNCALTVTEQPHPQLFCNT